MLFETWRAQGDGFGVKPESRGGYMKFGMALRQMGKSCRLLHT